MTDIHIASCVAYTRPDAVEAVVRAIRATGLAEVPRHDPNGRIVVLLEAPGAGRILDAMDAIRALDGVLAVHLAYQHVEPEADLQEPHE